MRRTAGSSASETRLGILAMRFRGTKDEEERKDIAKEYSRTVRKLIKSGKWNDIPALEDQLPDECMPEFVKHWLTPPVERAERTG